MNGNRLPKDPRLLPTEAQEQATLFSWAEMQSGRRPELRLLFHIPNGGSRGKAEAARFKMEGVKPGVPDLFLPVPRGPWHGLFIELKRHPLERRYFWKPETQDFAFYAMAEVVGNVHDAGG